MFDKNSFRECSVDIDQMPDSGTSERSPLHSLPITLLGVSDQHGFKKAASKVFSRHDSYFLEYILQRK